MEYKGMASLWLGTTKSFNQLQEYVDMEYTEDGDSIDSKFGVNFDFGYYDEDQIEIMFYEEPKIHKEQKSRYQMDGLPMHFDTLFSPRRSK